MVLIEAGPTITESRETPDPETSVTDRAGAALLTCIARYGLAKTTLDDVARAAGCSRATLYRYFDGKLDLVQRTTAGELRRITSTVVDAASAEATFADAVVTAVVAAARELTGHAALRFLLEYEPAAVLAHLAFAPGIASSPRWVTRWRPRSRAGSPSRMRSAPATGWRACCAPTS